VEAVFEGPQAAVEKWYAGAPEARLPVSNVEVNYGAAEDSDRFEIHSDSSSLELYCRNDGRTQSA